MPIDDRIPDALGRAAGTPPRTVGSWADLRARAIGRRRKRRGQAGVALATLATLTAGLVFATNADDDHSIVTTPPASAEIAVAIGDKLVVLSADDGHVVRTLVTAPLKRTIGSFSASLDGGDVYYSLLDSYCQLPTEIWRVPSGGAAAAEQVALGGLPLVSPDGRWLAFAERITLDHPCLYDVDVVVRDLATGQEIRFPEPDGIVEPVAWSPDSNRLVVRRMLQGVRPVDVTLAVSSNGLAEVSAVDNQVQSYAFLPSGEPVTALPVGTTGSTISTFDPATEVGGGRTVMDIDRIGLTDLADVDSTGTRFLLFEYTESDDDRNLYRADLGEPTPALIAEHVNDAAWLSVPPRPGGEILAKVVDNGVPKLVVISATDGSVLREVSSDPVLGNFGGVSVLPDGSTAFITIEQPDPPTANCSSDIQAIPAVASVDLSDGRVTKLRLASAGPIVSPDGRRLAFHTGSGGCSVLPNDRDPALGFMDLVSGEVTRPYVDGYPRPFAPIAWSHDGSHLLADGPTGDNQTTSYLVLDQFPFDPDPTPIEPPQRFITATYLPDGRLVVAYSAEDPQRLGNDPLGTYRVVVVDDRGKIVERLFETTSQFHIEGIAADASGRLLLRSRFGGLAIWTPGDEEPVTLIAGGGPLEVQGAAWLPSEPIPVAPTAPTTTTTSTAAPTSRPDSIFAIQGTQLVKLASSDGEQRAVVFADLSARAFDNALSVSANRTKAAVIGVAATPCPRTPPEIEDRGGLAVVDLATGTTESIDLGPDVHSAFSPSLSPDGTRVAYVAQGCDGALHVVVRDLAAGADIPFDQDDDADPASIGGWDADGRRLLVGFYAADNQSAEWRFVDTESGASTAVGAMQLASIPGLPDELVPLGATGRWATAREESDHGRRIVNVVEYDLGTSERGPVLLAWRDLPEFAGPVHLVASDPSGRHLLLLAERRYTGGAGTAYQLYRWSEGEEEPTQVKEVVGGADW